MFIGHFAAGFGLKRAAPAVSLGTLFLGAQLLDLIWPTLLQVGWERAAIAPHSEGPPLEFTHYPISHSLAMTAVWAGVFGGVYWAWRRDRMGALVCGLAVLSHWLLDLVVHLPDLPLWPGGDIRLGFGLWRSLPGALALEFAALGAGVWLYVRATEPRDRIGSLGLWILVLGLGCIQLGNTFGPPPPSVSAVAWVGQAQWLLVLLGYWIDRHRRGRDVGS
jgi:membrane-bound metal-dependent hydrolase YbcI (DUF457 family)